MLSSNAANYDFLIGLTESAAYELAQDHCLVVRITSRDGQPIVCTRDFRPDDRINFIVVENKVTAWRMG